MSILRKAGCPFLMSRKQLFRQLNNQTVAEIFERFVASQTAKGVSDKTIQNYHSHLHSLQKHLDFSAPLATLTKEDLDNMVISMRQSGLAHNSISSYLRVFRTFLNWARKAGYTELEMANYKDKETVKDTYTDAELMLLLQKPARNCDFCEYRNWVIINFLVNSVVERVQFEISKTAMWILNASRSFSAIPKPEKFRRFHSALCWSAF